MSKGKKPKKSGKASGAEKARRDMDGVMALDLPFAERTPAVEAYFQKCTDKLGFVPNVLLAYAHDMAKLEAFTAFYNDLMLAPSGLSKLEREMIAVAVSSAEPLLLLPRRTRRRGAPAVGRSGARRDDGDELPRRRARCTPARHARFRREGDASLPT